MVKNSYIFWFLLLASIARKECSQQHFLNVRLFSKVQIWYPSHLGWDRVNYLAKKMSQWLDKKLCFTVKKISFNSGSFIFISLILWGLFWRLPTVMIFIISHKFHTCLIKVHNSCNLKGYSCSKAFKGAWTPNLTFWKWKRIQKMSLATFLSCHGS